MSDELLHLYRAHAEGHSKYVYFLLAATGAALGYALNKLDASAASGPVWLGLAAIVSWLASFLFGCLHIGKVQATIFSNYQLLQLKHGSHPMQPRSAEELEIAKRVTREAVEAKNQTAQTYFQFQSWLLAIGVVLFAAWRVALLFGIAP